MEEDVKKYTFNEDAKAEGVSLKCLNCGSPLEFNPETQLFVCSTCQSEFSREKLGRNLDDLNDDDEEQREFYDENIKEYHCPSCGAEILSDENTTTDFCVYCRNPVVFKGRVNGELKPDLIIPFKITKEEAKQILKEHLLCYGFIPDDFFEEANLDNVSGVYYPFWEADVDTNCTITATATKVDTWRAGDRRYTKTSYYDVYRNGDIHFEDLSVNALKSADKTLVEGVLPYPIKEHIPFDIAYLTGFHAKKNDLEFKDVRPEINLKMKDFSYKILRDSIGSYNSIKINSHNIRVKNQKKDYTLLPIWILSYKYNDKMYTFAVNGSTGKMFGDIPLSKSKLGWSFVSILFAIFLFATLLGGLFL